VPDGIEHLVVEESPHRRPRRAESPVEKNRAENGFADIPKQGGFLGAAGQGLALAEPQRFSHAPVARDVRAGLLAHQIGEAARQFAFIGRWKFLAKHFGNGEAEYAVAQKFQPLIRFEAALRLVGGQRARMGQGARKERRIAETIADALLQRVQIAERRA
jgi:hypothetical protein